MPLYFAYGSNMDETAMRARCPDTRALGIARLPAHRFVLMGNGYASVRPASDTDVYGVLYDLAPSDIAPLDRYEDVAGGLYVRAGLPVFPDGGTACQALVYLGCDMTTGGAVHAGYVEGIAAAAQAFALPGPYVAALRDMASTRHPAPGPGPSS